MTVEVGDARQLTQADASVDAEILAAYDGVGRRSLAWDVIVRRLA